MYSFHLSECPKSIVISSSEGATLWKDVLGRYTLLRYDNKLNAIYEAGSEYKVYLYRDSNGVWDVSHT